VFLCTLQYVAAPTVVASENKMYCTIPIVALLKELFVYYSLANLTRLKELNIYDTDLSNTDLHVLGSVSSLRHLTLSHCKLTSIPDR